MILEILRIEKLDFSNCLKSIPGWIPIQFISLFLLGKLNLLRNKIIAKQWKRICTTPWLQVSHSHPPNFSQGESYHSILAQNIKLDTTSWQSRTGHLLWYTYIAGHNDTKQARQRCPYLHKGKQGRCPVQDCTETGMCPALAFHLVLYNS